MSFRLFVYWCSLCGGWAALAGWGLGRLLAGDDPLGSAGIKGMCLGLLIALALCSLDAVWVFSLRQLWRILPRVLLGATVGGFGGLAGGFVGQLLYAQDNQPVYLLLGWALTGLMVGVSIGTYDFLGSWVREEDLRGIRRKVLRGILGGLGGGLLGGFLYEQLLDVWDGIFPGKADLWSPSATGFVVLGLCIGLWIGVAQVVLKEAWLYIEAGFRKGREFPLNKSPLSIGRAESCDLGLFGDATIDLLHAHIVRVGNDYQIADAGSSNGVQVNKVRITEPTLLRTGDLIQMGKARLRFRERQKREK
jgi:hypothetical protein